ncbi:MAG: hypothetical protein NC301_07425 [Bacteroides sp.]|nr:hypothetical protein [Bacteroides sp.]MCM1380003.1 hypothetical protein [Bacteroides sp.]MCM1446317.1 hypothetical protein [Prevotella sp.]
MPKLITNNDALRALIPNQLITVKGETSLFEKLVPFIDAAEQWIQVEFTGSKIFDDICALGSGNIRWLTAARLAVADAMKQALPSLDVVFTANGLATVGTQNLVAASKARVDRLMASMAELRDEAIDMLLRLLPEFEGWNSTRQAEFFGATLFPNFNALKSLPTSDESKWDRYIKVRTQIIDLEAFLAALWLSRELMDALRAENLIGKLSRERGELVRRLRAQIIKALESDGFDQHRLAELVEFIRQRPDDFPEWHSSTVAEFFNPPVFKNQKTAAGYFF